MSNFTPTPGQITVPTADAAVTVWVTEEDIPNIEEVYGPTPEPPAVDYGTEALWDERLRDTEIERMLTW